MIVNGIFISLSMELYFMLCALSENPGDMSEWTKTVWWQPLGNAFFAVDTFFFLRSGILSFVVCRRFNSLAPGEFECNFRHAIFKRILVIDGWGISCEIALIWMSLDFTDDQSTLVPVMAWCRQATSHYRNQCWPRSLSPYGVTRPQWVNDSTC